MFGKCSQRVRKGPDVYAHVNFGPGEPSRISLPNELAYAPIVIDLTNYPLCQGVSLSRLNHVQSFAFNARPSASRPFFQHEWKFAK